MRIGTRWLASPGLVFIAFMVGGPMAVIVWYSFRTRGPGGVGVGDGLTTDAYERLAVTEDFAGNVGFDATYLDVMWSSILLAAATMLIALVIGFPTAVWISNRPRHLQPLLILAVTIPFWTSMLVRTYAWIVILRETGPLASAFDSIGMMNDQVEVIHAVLRAVGATPCSTDPADYGRAEELLDGFKPSVSVINSDGIIERMAAGRTRSTWSGTERPTGPGSRTRTSCTSIPATG